MKRKSHIGGTQLPLITPDSSWVLPKGLPDLRNVGVIALDRETKDSGLAAGRGPGWAHKAGYICGTSIAWEGGSFYAPLNHPDTECFNEDQLKRWEEDHAKAGVLFVMHNAGYDCGWAKAEWNSNPPPKLADTTALAALIDENRLSYTLDSLCIWRGIPGKYEGPLKEAAAAYGFEGQDIKGNLWQLPARYVGPYAEADAVATLALYNSLIPELESQELVNAYKLECDLIPMVLEMRYRGIKVNLEEAYRVQGILEGRRDTHLKDLSEKLQFKVDLELIRSARKLEPLFTKANIPFPRTPKTGVGSFDSDWMEQYPHWLPNLVVKIRQAEDAANKFVKEYILGYAHKGRLHASINQFRSEDGGTRSHRFSYADPPLQQIPSRDKEMAPLIRGIFEPEEGEYWGAMDMSQQEYRLIVHYADLLNCRKARDAVMQYQEDPNTDFHSLVANWTGLERRSAKDANFAKAFGAGVDKFAVMIRKSKDEAKAIYEKYDKELPFVSELSERCNKVASRRGYIRLLDGARSHFDFWESSNWDENRDASGVYIAPRPLDAAKEKWPNSRLRRAFTHKSMNRLIQGSAARQIKMAMRACWKEGLVPLLQMHDELDFSILSKAQADCIVELMRDVVSLSVPMLVDAEFGKTWGDAKHTWSELND